MRWKIVFLMMLAVVLMVSSQDNDETTEAPTTEEQTTEEATTSDDPETTEAITSEEPQETTSTDEANEAKTSKSTTKAKKQTTAKIKDNNVTKSPKKESPKCTPWPSNLRSLRECCNVPHNPASIQLNTCFYRCAHRETAEKRQVECGASCFVNTTGILSYSGRLNKDRVKNLYISTMMAYDKWTRVIEDGVDKCDFNEKSSLHSALARFFACINDYMADHCVNFIQSHDCEKTQELYESCHDVKPNCDRWPAGLENVESCCKFPPLFSSRLIQKCRYECDHKELFPQRQLRCVEACLYNDTKLRVEGKFNYDAVREMLTNSVIDVPEWKKPIGDAVEKCRRNIESNTLYNQRFSVEFEITSLQACLRDHLTYNCVEFKDDSYCRRLGSFMKKCPDVKPKKIIDRYYHERRVYY